MRFWCIVRLETHSRDMRNRSNILLCFLAFGFGVATSLPPEAFPVSKQSACNPEVDYSIDCQFKNAECRIVYFLLHGMEGGLISHLFNCSFVLQIPLDMAQLLQFYPSIENETISSLDFIDNTVPNDADKTAMRKCLLDQSHLLTPDGVINRTGIAQRFKDHLYWSPKLSKTLSKAAFACPEPVQFVMRPFFLCLKDICLANAPGMLDMFTGIEDDSDIDPLNLDISEVPTASPFVSGGFAI